VEMIACVVIVPVISRFGRRNSHIFCLAGAGFAMFLDEILRDSLQDTQGCQTAELVLFLFAKFCISGSFNMLFLYIPELFPTPVRNTAVGVCTIGARIASACSPYIIHLLNPQPRLLRLGMGCTCAMAMYLTWGLPETKGVPMLTTMEEAIDFYEGRITGEVRNNNNDEVLIAKQSSSEDVRSSKDDEVKISC